MSSFPPSSSTGQIFTLNYEGKTFPGLHGPSPVTNLAGLYVNRVSPGSTPTGDTNSPYQIYYDESGSNPAMTFGFGADNERNKWAFIHGAATGTPNNGVLQMLNNQLSADGTGMLSVPRIPSTLPLTSGLAVGTDYMATWRQNNTFIGNAGVPITITPSSDTSALIINPGSTSAADAVDITYTGVQTALNIDTMNQAIQVSATGSSVAIEIDTTGSGVGLIIDVSAGIGSGMLINCNNVGRGIQISQTPDCDGILISTNNSIGTSLNIIQSGTDGGTGIFIGGGGGSQNGIIVNEGTSSGVGLDVTGGTGNSVNVTGGDIGINVVATVSSAITVDATNSNNGLHIDGPNNGDSLTINLGNAVATGISVNSPSVTSGNCIILTNNVASTGDTLQVTGATSVNGSPAAISVTNGALNFGRRAVTQTGSTTDLVDMTGVNIPNVVLTTFTTGALLAGTSYTFTVENYSVVNGASSVLLTIANFGGAKDGSNGIPVVYASNIGNSTFDIVVANAGISAFTDNPLMISILVL